MLVLEYAVPQLTANGVMSVSHYSHIGGLVSGLVVSFLFLPNFHDRRWRAARRLARRVDKYHAGVDSRNPSSGSLPVVEEVEPSCWRKHMWAYVILWSMSATVVLFFFAGLPIYLWVQMLPNLSCPAQQ